VISLGNQKHTALAGVESSCGTWVSMERGSLSYRAAWKKTAQRGRRRLGALCGSARARTIWKLDLWLLLAEPELYVLGRWFWCSLSEEGCGDEDHSILLSVSSALCAEGQSVQ